MALIHSKRSCTKLYSINKAVTSHLQSVIPLNTVSKQEQEHVLLSTGGLSGTQILRCITPETKRGNVVNRSLAEKNLGIDQLSSFCLSQENASVAHPCHYCG